MRLKPQPGNISWQAQAAMTNITHNGLALFDYGLQVYAQSFLGPIAHAAEDTHRSDFPTTMAPSILKNTSYNVPISYPRSCCVDVLL